MSLRKASITKIAAVSAFMVSPSVLASQDVSQEELRVQLQEAKQVIQDAQSEAEAIIRAAYEQAREIRTDSEGADFTPLEVQNAKVSIEINAGTLQEIVTAIMPSHWRVMVDSDDANLNNRRFQFVSTRTREQSLNDLLLPLGLKHQYFFDLKDGNGDPSPMLIVSSN